MDSAKMSIPPDPPLASFSIIEWACYAVRYVLWMLFYPILFFF